MAAPSPWVILRRLLGVVPKHGEAEQPAAISTALRAPPRVTILGVGGPNARPEPTRPVKVPYLVAAGPAGLLICFAAGEPPIETDEDLVVAREFLAPADPSRQPTTGSAERVPRRRGSMPATCTLRSLGLTSGLLPGDYVITELQVASRGGERARLLRFFSAERLWLDTDLHNPLSAVDGGRNREWAPAGVVAHGGKLWFLDLSWGLLSCDPSATLPVLRFHSLPPGRCIHEPKPFLHTIRCVGVSNHMLRYVDIACDLDLDGRRAAEKKVSVWTAIPDPDCGGGGHGIRWLKTYEMGFEEIWSDGSYRETQLPAMIPEISCTPGTPMWSTSFCGGASSASTCQRIGSWGFVEDAHKLVAPGCRRCVLPWDLPASIANGLVEAIVPFQDQCGSSETTTGSSD
ncbi:hypothetical protein PVAP13_4KG140810 [Panicum virgatum]|uniref:DUF1618 domain-containing protein n=1 Tax=Panicum virgatum TaxID=38727 RepID=A0A8T0TN67_PANVG|nr:hypothetical protein PVAP13_4KG140810 [Panicum virgatum]